MILEPDVETMPREKLRVLQAQRLRDLVGYVWEVVDADHRLRALRERVAHLIKDTLGCTMSVRLMSPGSVPRSEGGKLQRVVDSREFV